jgi:hypothetical protein
VHIAFLIGLSQVLQCAHQEVLFCYLRFDFREMRHDVFCFKEGGIAPFPTPPGLSGKQTKDTGLQFASPN